MTVDFDSVRVEWSQTAFGELQKFSFEDKKLEGYHLIVAADTELQEKAENSRLFTGIFRFPRPILSEVNTHRVFGRNSASSRARAVKSTIASVMGEPYIPLWTINKKGMSGRFASEETWTQATKQFLEARDSAVGHVLGLLLGEQILSTRGDGLHWGSVATHWEELLGSYYESGYNPEGEETTEALSIHKGNVNRLLEPFMFHEAIITSSYWDNFIALRDHEEAMPEIRAIARLLRVALATSKSVEHWVHAPFVNPNELPASPTDFDSVRPLLMLSANESAQVSYGDKSTAKVSTASASKGERLLAMKHYSPFEHQAIARAAMEEVIGLSSDQSFTRNPEQWVSNLDSSWVQFRSLLAGITK